MQTKVSSKKLLYLDVPGFFDFHDVYDLAIDRAVQQGRNRLVEVGSLFGRSAVYLAQQMIDHKVPGKLLVVDTFYTQSDAVFHENIFAPKSPYSQIVNRHGSLLKAFQYYVSACDVDNKIEVVVKDSVTAAIGTTNDFVFIDANHTYEAIHADIKAWMPTIAPGGILAGHDYDNMQWPGVVMAVDEAFGKKNIRVMGKSWLVQL